MKLLTIIFLLIYVNPLFAQVFKNLEVEASGGLLELVFENDPSAHLIVGGSFGETLMLHPNDSDQVYQAGSRKNAFVSKIDSLGTVAWTRAFIGKAVSEIIAIESDEAGNTYCIGAFNFEKFDADPGKGEAILLPEGGGGNFIVKLDTKGDFIWVKQFNARFYDFALDEAANIFIGGYYYNWVDLNPGVDSFIFNTPKQSDGFVVKLDNQGDFIWATKIGQTMLDEITAVEVDPNGDVILAGVDKSTLKEKPGIRSVFINKIKNENGQSIWSKEIQSDKLVEIAEIAVDRTGSIFISGEFESSIQFNGESSRGNFKSKGYADAFLYKVNAKGHLEWSYQLGEAFQDEGKSIFIDENSLIYWSGKVGYGMHLNEKEFYPDNNFFLIFKPTGSLYRNMFNGHNGTDKGFQFFDGSGKYIYYCEQIYFNKWLIKRFW